MTSILNLVLVLNSLRVFAAGAGGSCGGRLLLQWRVDFKRFPESKVMSLPMLLLAGPPRQGPARGGGRGGAGGTERRHQEGEQASDGDTSEYSGSSSEEGDAPVSVGTKRDYTRQRTAAPGLVNMDIEGRATPTPGAGAWKATSSQWAARGGPEMLREIDGGGGGGDSGAAEEMDRDGADGGREGSKMGSRRLIMAAAKTMAVQRKRYFRMGAAWAV